ncbi:MAG: type IV secretory system conjugative DNA transfer family protein [Phycisphaerales bacterium]
MTLGRNDGYHDVPLYRSDELPLRPQRHQCALYGAGKLASEEEFKRAEGALRGDERVELLLTPLLEASVDGRQLAAYPFRNTLLDSDILDRHLLGLGQTGEGKTMRFILPLYYSLLSRTNRTLVVVNAKGPAFTRVLVSAARRARPGATPKILAFRSPTRSARWNPIGGKSAANAFALARAIIETAESPSCHSDSPFWRQSSTELLHGMLMTDAVRSLDDAWTLSRLPFPEFVEFAGRYAGVPQLARFASFLGSGSQNAETIMQDLAMRLAHCGVLDALTRAVTTGPSELDLKKFIAEGGGVLIVEVNEPDVPSLRPLLTLFVNELMDALITQAESEPSGRLKVPAAIIIDEFASALGRIPDAHVKVNTLRSRGATIIAAVQSLAQLDLVYGSAGRVLLNGFSTIATVGALAEADREFVSHRSGLMTVSVWLRSEEFDPATGDYLPKSRSENILPRQVLLAGELNRPPHPIFGPYSVLFMPGRPPFFAHLTAAWQIPALEAVLDHARTDDPALNLLRKRPLRVSRTNGGTALLVVTRSLPCPWYISDTASWSEERILNRLDDPSLRLPVEGAAAAAWWSVVREDLNPEDLLRVTEELVHRNAGVALLYQAYVEEKARGSLYCSVTLTGNML